MCSMQVYKFNRPVLVMTKISVDIIRSHTFRLSASRLVRKDAAALGVCLHPIKSIKYFWCGGSEIAAVVEAHGDAPA